MTSEAIPAATVVVFRNAPDGGAPQILMVTRSRDLKFAGGMAVFPGGRVDPADYELGERLAGELDADEAAHRIAAIRETLEETGLAIGVREPVDAATARAARGRLAETQTLAPVLEEFGWTLDLAAIAPFARWWPQNEKLPRVFDTRFYLADLGTGAVDIAVDETENTRLFWTRAADALDAADRGEIGVIFPTRRNLERLAQFDTAEAAFEQARAIPVRTIVPALVEDADGRWLTILEDAGYPVTREKLDRVQRG